MISMTIHATRGAAARLQGAESWRAARLTGTSVAVFAKNDVAKPYAMTNAPKGTRAWGPPSA